MNADKVIQIRNKIADFKVRKSELYDEVKAIVQDTDIFLSLRWEIFCEAETGERSVNAASGWLIGEKSIDWYGDFDVQPNEHSIVYSVEIINELEEAIYDNNEERYSFAESLNQENVDKLKELILKDFTWGFIFDC